MGGLSGSEEVVFGGFRVALLWFRTASRQDWIGVDESFVIIRQGF